jgi:hypothetical protein
MGFLNQVAEKRISSSRVGWRSWWVEDAVAALALRTAQDRSRLESPLSQGSVEFAGLDLYSHDASFHLAIIGSETGEAAHFAKRAVRSRLAN